MERLSERFMYYCGLLTGYMYLSNSDVDIDDFVDDIKHVQDLIDAEEQGLLLRLPCKVGDRVYLLYKKECYEYVVAGFQFYEGQIQVIERSGCRIGVIGKTVFLTQEEAEQKLAEMRGK